MSGTWNLIWRDVAKNISKIYFFRIMAMATNFLSTIVVVPYLTADPTQFAVYSVCIAITFIMTYGDLGIVAAAQKFASEAYGRGSISREAAYLQVTGIFIIILGLIFACVCMTLALHPSLFLPNSSPQGLELASKMLIIMGCSTPLIFYLQRLVTLYLSSRLIDYKVAQWDTIANVLKIMSVSFFAGDSRFAIEWYFLFCQLISLIALSLVGAMYAKIWVFEQFNVKDCVENLVELIPLASASLVSTLCFVLFYEVDVLIAGQLFEAGGVATYALCITVLNFIRSIYNVILGPALPILNRLKGEGNDQGVLVVAAGAALVGGAFVLVLVVVAAFAAPYLIPLWVGFGYEASFSLLLILLMGGAFAGVANIASYLSVCLQDRWVIILLGAVPVGSFVTVLASYAVLDRIDLEGLAVAKGAATLVLGLFSMGYLCFKIRGFGLYSLILLFIFVFVYQSCDYIFVSGSGKDFSGDYGEILVTIIYVLLLVCFSIGFTAFAHSRLRSALEAR